ncbi:hypothetical protein MSG28_002395 [Choristoneura fumiferana]|uniref:Uncharacterized protein n=4 Tax=Choristoneura fumiferana TaxID=7141 RepID=A0ACC0JVN1_CHOFU|nr:hypothetical protein MSG28_002395 [Choristoneura fumiferana]KAI8428146.1 hypothetical protein MSG28_002395 [Choristoneura fumiferana]KAI8428147.1 hypothetical protein MSG28_002395 [Choristoneura fumiferana]KAI8428148.1 hypothetical protein MSG28_002395 [Choristoneura fumiferana]
MNCWIMPKKQYVMFRWLCVTFSCAYALAPALGVGGYGPDFTCSSCTMDMVLPDGWRKYIVAMIFFLRSVKPVCVMIYMLIGCKAFKKAYNDSPNNQLQRKITQDAIVMTCICLVCWTPIATIRGWVVLMQLIYGSGVFVLPTEDNVKWALLLHWVSLTPTVLALFLLDSNIQRATLQLRLGTFLGHIKNKIE